MNKNVKKDRLKISGKNLKKIYKLTLSEEISIPDCFKKFNAFSTVSDCVSFDFGFIKDS